MFRREDLFIIVSFIVVSGLFLFTYHSYIDMQSKHDSAQITISMLLTRISTLEEREKTIIEISNDVLTEYSEFKITKEKEIINQSKNLFFYKQKYYDYFTKYNNLVDEHDRLKMILVRDNDIVIEDGSYLQGVAFMDKHYYCIYDKGESLSEQLYTVIHEWAHFRGYKHETSKERKEMDKFVLETAEEYLKQYSY